MPRVDPLSPGRVRARASGVPFIHCLPVRPSIPQTAANSPIVAKTHLRCENWASAQSTEMTSPLTNLGTISTPESYYTARNSPSNAADETALTSPVEPPQEDDDPGYRDAVQLPHVLKSHCQIHLEEQLCMFYSQSTIYFLSFPFHANIPPQTPQQSTSSRASSATAAAPAAPPPFHPFHPTTILSPLPLPLPLPSPSKSASTGSQPSPAPKAHSTPILRKVVQSPNQKQNRPSSRPPRNSPSSPPSPSTRRLRPARRSRAISTRRRMHMRICGGCLARSGR